MPLNNPSTPVLFLVFNRPDMTRKVFAEIRRAAPKRLYVACDGPRENFPDDQPNIKEVCGIVADVNWDCTVKTLFREKNLGCKKAISSAIDWFFDNEEEGIILEDDCLPDQSFFLFCTELLKRYRSDERVMMISGNNFLGSRIYGEDSYYFSKYCHIWGWASWRKAWKHYDVSMRLWPQLRENGFLRNLDQQEQLYWRWCFDQVFSGKIDTWDYQWEFACLVNKGFSVMPRVNLVSNIGFGDDSTHTKKHDSRLAGVRTESITLPLIHPENVSGNRQADRLMVDSFYTMSALKYMWRVFKEKVRGNR